MRLYKTNTTSSLPWTYSYTAAALIPNHPHTFHHRLPPWRSHAQCYIIEQPVPPSATTYASAVDIDIDAHIRWHPFLVILSSATRQPVPAIRHAHGQHVSSPRPQTKLIPSNLHMPSQPCQQSSLQSPSEPQAKIPAKKPPTSADPPPREGKTQSPSRCMHPGHSLQPGPGTITCTLHLYLHHPPPPSLRLPPAPSINKLSSRRQLSS